MEYPLIDSSQALAELCDEARANGRVALDTEFLWERTYAPQICLVQLNVGGKVVLADPLEGVDLEPVAELISDPAVTVIMHAPHADLVAFCVRYGTEPTAIFDTQIAAGFAGYSAGLAYERLVAEVTGQKVQPSESFSDWSRRPLAAKQLRYAGEDVEHLFNVTDTLTESLVKLGRDSWAQEEFARRFFGAERFVTEPLEAWRKVGRRGKLGPRDLAVLREVAAWRENIARHRDLPVGWVAKDPTLIEISRRKPTEEASLAKVRGVDGSMRSRDLAELAAAVRRGLEGAPIKENNGTSAPRGIRKRTAVAKGLATALLRARCEAQDLAPELVGTSADVEELIAWVSHGRALGGDDIPFLLRGWREPFGDELVRLAEGKIQLQLVPEEPYLKIIGLEPAT